MLFLILTHAVFFTIFIVSNKSIGAQIQGQVITNLRFTDDIVLRVPMISKPLGYHCQPSILKYLKSGVED